GGLRALMPLAPVHLRAVAAGEGGLDISWIRRSRVDADSWLGADIPLGEEREAYRVRIRDAEANTLRETMTASPAWHYAAAERAADSKAGLPLTLEVRQISAAVGDGLPATLALEPR